MNQRAIIQAAEKYVQKLLATEGTGHDWHHIDRVRKMALTIAQEEKADLFLVELMALLHDVPDRKVAGRGNEKKALLTVRGWLEEQGLTTEETEEILYVISHQSYSDSGLRGEKLPSLEGRVMQDADRLDALGAIGIARCFAYNGKRGNPMHDPARPPRINITAAEYKKDEDTSINHFYEKLLKLRDLMNTETGKRLAAERHKFIEDYLEQFFAEWDGKR